MISDYILFQLIRIGIYISSLLQLLTFVFSIIIVIAPPIILDSIVACGLSQSLVIWELKPRRLIDPLEVELIVQVDEVCRSSALDWVILEAAIIAFDIQMAQCSSRVFGDVYVASNALLCHNRGPVDSSAPEIEIEAGLAHNTGVRRSMRNANL